MIYVPLTCKNEDKSKNGFAYNEEQHDKEYVATITNICVHICKSGKLVNLKDIAHKSSKHKTK